MTDEFTSWVSQLHDLDRGRIAGCIQAFDIYGSSIAEPHGRVEAASRHFSQMYSISAQRGSNAYVVFCYLGQSTTYVVHGYDPNVNFAHQAELRFADDLVDQHGPFV